MEGRESVSVLAHVRPLPMFDKSSEKTIHE